jgi:hypothetical protein
MIFKLKEKKDRELENMYKKAMKELDKFFGLNWKRNTPSIIIVKTRKEIDQLNGYKTEPWLIAWVERNKIYLLDGKKYKKESSHRYSKEDYFKTVKHELSHLFFGIVSKANTYNQFIWLNEGVAGFLSEQYKNRTKPKKFEKFLDQYSNWWGNAYNESYYAIKCLADKFGKEKLLKLIKSLSKIRSQKDFNTLFKKIYGSNPTYQFFNKLI